MLVLERHDPGSSTLIIYTDSWIVNFQYPAVLKIDADFANMYDDFLPLIDLLIYKANLLLMLQ